MNEFDDLSPDPFDDELWSLVTAYCDGTASQEQCSRLEARLRTETAAKACYLRYVRLHAALQLRSRREPFTLAGMLREQVESSQPPAAGGPLLGESSCDAPGTTSFLMFGANRHGPFSDWRSFVIWSVLLAALLPVVGVLVLPFSGHLGPRAANAAESVALGSLVRTVNCIWRTGNLPTYEGAQLSRGVLRLERGEAAVQFASGVKAVLQGPVDFELTTEMRCFVHSGRAVVKVPLEASGFMVGTPVAKVMSHGSEIGVQVEEGRRLLAYVFEGEAEFEPNPHLPAAAAVQTVTAGQPSIIGSDGSDETSAGTVEPKEFIREVRHAPMLLTPGGEVNVVNVEFGPKGNDAYRGLGAIGLTADDDWNQVWEIGAASARLMDANRRPTDASVTVDAQMMFTTEFHASGNAFHDDICWVRDGGSVGRFVIRGLIPGNRYDLYLYGTTGICPRRPADYEVGVGAPEGSVFTVGGESKATVGLRVSDRPFTPGRDYITFERVAADEAGEIRGTWTNNPQANAPLNNNPFAPFNGFQIVGKFRQTEAR